MSVVKNAQLHPQLALNQTSSLFDDFYAYTSGGLWTTSSSGGGTSAASAVDDEVVLTTGAGSGDYQGVWLTNPDFLWNNIQGMYAECYFNMANLTDQAFFFGFSSSKTAFASATADPSASYSGAVLYFLLGGTNVKAQSSNGSAKTTSQSVNCPWANGTVNPAVNHLFRIDVVQFDAAHALVTYSCDGVLLKDSNGIQITHQVPYASLAQMYVGSQVVSAGSADVANLDYMSAGKFRMLLL